MVVVWLSTGGLAASLLSYTGEKNNQQRLRDPRLGDAVRVFYLQGM